LTAFLLLAQPDDPGDGSSGLSKPLFSTRFERPFKEPTVSTRRALRVHPVLPGPPASDNPLVAWFDDEVGWSAAEYLATLREEALVATSPLHADWPRQPDAALVAAYLLLTDFGTSKGLRLGEVIMLLPSPIQTALRGLNELARRDQKTQTNYKPTEWTMD